MGSTAHFLSFLPRNYSRDAAILEERGPVAADCPPAAQRRKAPAEPGKIVADQLCRMDASPPKRRSTLPAVRWGSCALLAALLLGCSAPPPAPRPQAPAENRTTAPVIRTPMPQTPAASAPAIELPLPAGAVYVCVTEIQGRRQETVIEFPTPRVRDLCRKNPEMGPCQYERNACRRGGGRVYAADGAEITAQTEAEYDKKVLRVRFKSN
jgi:hypothetical protein